jgi:hypothetical protein
MGPRDQIFVEHEGNPKIIYTPRLAGNAPFAHVGAHRGCQSVVLSGHMAKTRHSGRMFGRKTARKRPKRGSEDQNWPNQEGQPKSIYTPRLAGNAPFAHVGAPRGCQSVVLGGHKISSPPCVLRSQNLLRFYRVRLLKTSRSGKCSQNRKMVWQN